MLSFFIARRYFAQALKTKSMALPLWFSIMILFIATLGLSLAVSTTQAFQEKTFQKFEETNADAIISSYGNKLDYESIDKKIRLQIPDQIAGTTPQSSHSLIITNDEKQALVQIRSIDPKTDLSVTNLEKKLLKNNQTLCDLLKKNCIIIGSTLARNLDLAEKKTAECYIPNTAINSKKITLTESILTISGQFHIGLDECDSGIVFCSQETFSLLTKSSPNLADVILVRFAPQKNGLISFFDKLNPLNPSQKDTGITLLKKTLPHLTVQTWQELYPAIISALKLEQFAALCLLFLLIIIALFSITSSLVTLIYHKQRDIALFQTLGMPNSMIRNIFLWVGIIVVTISSCAGSVIGYFVSYLLETYKLISLPDVYYVSYLPASTNPFIFIAIPIGICSCSILILFAGIWQAQKMNSLETLRHTT
ncbi:ABC transporter permease [Candidatus Dependentiae bacterium]|nr:ABC transporter permease [Candidatus Dependentiae bacterium]